MCQFHKHSDVTCKSNVVLSFEVSLMCSVQFAYIYFLKLSSQFESVHSFYERENSLSSIYTQHGMGCH